MMRLIWPTRRLTSLCEEFAEFQVGKIKKTVSLFCILWAFHHLCSESFQLSINVVVDREWFSFLFPELLRAVESKYVSGFDLESQHACFLDFVLQWLLVIDQKLLGKARTVDPSPLAWKQLGWFKLISYLILQCSIVLQALRLWCSEQTKSDLDRHCNGWVRVVGSKRYRKEQETWKKNTRKEKQ
jgi:hypothetical protein